MWFAWRELWSRRWRSLLALLSLALSVGLIVATGSIGEVMQAGIASSAPLLGHPADQWVSSAYDVDYDLPAGLAARVEAVPGVAGVQPVLRRPVRVLTSASSLGASERQSAAGSRADTLSLLGVQPGSYLAFHDLTLAAGALPSTDVPGLLALAPWAFVREVGLGQLVTVTVASGDVALPVVGLVEVESLAAAQQGLVLYAPLDTVARLFGLQDSVTALELRLEPDVSPRRVQAALERALGPAYAVSAASRPGQGTQLWQRLVLGALIFVDGLTLAGSTLLIYAVFASAARSRRRQIGLLRTAGAQRGQVLALLSFELVFLGLAGSGLGWVLGLLFAWLGSALVIQQTGGPALPRLSIGWLVLALTLGLLASLAGGLSPAVRAARQPPLVALYARASPKPSLPGRRHRRWVPCSLACAVPPEIVLAAANLVRERRRAALIVCALALILTMALGNVGILSLLGEELAGSLGRLAGGDYLVLPGLTTISLRELAGQDTSDMPPLSPKLLADLARLKDWVWLMGGTTADIEALQVFPGQPTLLLDMEGYAQMGGFRFQEGDWPRALEIFRRGPAVLLTPLVARRLDVGLGDTLQLTTRQGPVAFQVAGIGDSEFTTCILDMADGLVYLGANEVNAVMVQLRPKADGEVVRRTLLDIVQSHGATLLPLGQVSAQLREVFRQVQLSISLLIGITGLVAVLGVINAVIASIAERRREIGLLRAVGATQQQIYCLILSEMALLGAAAAMLGTMLGWAATLVFLGIARGSLGLTGRGIPWSAWLPVLFASAASLVLWPLLAMLSGAMPAVQVARQPVVPALSDPALR
jgi:putative ABC transport system permease protein